MSIASEIIDLNANLAAAKAAVTTAGGTVGDTGLAGIASEIGTIPTGGIADWGSITYDDNGISRTATLESFGDFMSLCGTGSTRTVTAGATTTTIDKITGVTLRTFIDVIPDSFLNYATALASLSLPSGVKSIGMSFLYESALSSPLILPSSLKSIGDFFMYRCAFNSSITLPSGLTTIGGYFLDSSTTFNKPLDFSACTSLERIGDNFLQGCTTFNSSITLPSGLTTIGNYFLRGCTSFNKDIILPSGLTTIGSYFLGDCIPFNKDITLPSGLTTIGSYFLGGCTAFNKDIILPSGLTSIGYNFLLGCTSFNKDIVLPDTITSIGGNFLYQVDSMTSTVYTGNLMPQIAEQNNNSFGAFDNRALCYTTGISISGTYASDWASRFPNRTSRPYRKLNVV